MPAATATRRGPVDPRLWRYSRPARRYLVLTTALSVVSTASIIVAAYAIGTILGGVITTPTRRSVGSWTLELVALIVAVSVRAAASWAQGRYGHRAATRVVADLEVEVLGAAAAMPEREVESRRAELAVVVTRGLTGLRVYLAEYFPALILAAIVPPAVIVAIAVADLTSAVIVTVTLPLIPLFMVLIGLLTRDRSKATLASMATLASQLLDLLAGLPTLRALGRERGPEARVRELGDAHRHAAIKSLRIAFLSSFVLELLATLSVAVVAVSIGLRLVFGSMPLAAGITALILAPEVYQPLRALGAKFHAAQDGFAAAQLAFGVIEQSQAVAPAAWRASADDGIMLDQVSVRSRNGFAPAGVSARLRPGTVTVLTGPNGSGKSTTLQVILGLIAPAAGTVTTGETDRDRWWGQVAWLPQRPVLLAGSLRDNLQLTGAVRDDLLDQACAATGFDAVLRTLPNGWKTQVGDKGTGLSLGERQRLALTRVLASGRDVLLLDEPTAHLDPESESKVLDAIVARAEAGATVVMVAHRPTVLAVADRIVEVRADVA